jgi:ATP-dependent RNA helicase DeaD
LLCGTPCLSKKEDPLSTQDTAQFQSLPLRPELQRAIQDLGFEKPSPIQAQALPLLLEKDTDFIGLAATGTGKTVAFTLPMLERINPAIKHVQAIILCPTRELCLQVAGQVDLLGKHMGIRSLAIYGGTGYDDQLRGLRTGTPIVVGTPGRMIDHLERGTLKLNHVRIAVLDEADEMISMGFREDMEAILESVPSEASNTWLFSATMSPQVRRVADEFLRDPEIVQVNRTEKLSSTIQQIGYLTQEKNKPEVLCKLIDAADDFYGVIFCQMKSLVVDLTRYLSERGYKVDCLHGDMSQAARESAMQAFRDKRLKILVCTDVASRGLDVKDITHVVNYSLPRELDLYVHRIGRTGRAGKTGIAMSLITPSHRHLANRIERTLKTKLEKGEVPTRREIGLKKIARELENFKAIEGADKALELLDDSWKEAVADMTPQEVAARFLSEKFPWVFSTSFERPQMQRTPRPEMNERKPFEAGDRKSSAPKERKFSGGASAKSRKPQKEIVEQPISAETKSLAHTESFDSAIEEIDQNRAFDDGFAENGAPVVKSATAPAKKARATSSAAPRKKPSFPARTKEKFFKRRADEPRKYKPHLEEKPRFQKSGYDPLAYSESRVEHPKPKFKKPEFGGTHKSFKHKRPFFMKEGAAPPAKFKPRAQRFGDLPPRRSKQD